MARYLIVLVRLTYSFFSCHERLLRILGIYHWKLAEESWLVDLSDCVVITHVDKTTRKTCVSERKTGKGILESFVLGAFATGIRPGVMIPHQMV